MRRRLGGCRGRGVQRVCDHARRRFRRARALNGRGGSLFRVRRACGPGPVCSGVALGPPGEGPLPAATGSSAGGSGQPGPSGPRPDTGPAARRRSPTRPCIVRASFSAVAIPRAECRRADAAAAASPQTAPQRAGPYADHGVPCGVRRACVA